MFQNLGRVGIYHRGEYHKDAEYNHLDLVTYENVGAFLCKSTCSGVPPTNTDYWNVVLTYKDFEHPKVFSEAALTGIDNKIQMDGIVSRIGLEVGDVIQVKQSDTAMDGKLYTVEAINSDDEIIVNYEHCGGRGNGSLKLVDFSGDIEFSRIAKWYNAPMGLGQAWVVVTNFRASTSALTYTNSSGRTIKLSVYGNGVSGGQAYIYVGQPTIVIHGSQTASNVYSYGYVAAEIPNGFKYGMYCAGGRNAAYELR